MTKKQNDNINTAGPSSSDYTVVRIGLGKMHAFAVVARSEREAAEKALILAQDHVYTDVDADFYIDDMLPSDNAYSIHIDDLSATQQGERGYKVGVARDGFRKIKISALSNSESERRFIAVALAQEASFPNEYHSLYSVHYVIPT